MHASFFFRQVVIFTPWNCLFHLRRSCVAIAHVRGSVCCGLLATLFCAATPNHRLHYHSFRAPHQVPDMPPKGILRITTLAEFLTVCLAGNRKEVHVSSFLQSSSQYVWQVTRRTCTYHHFYGIPHNVPGRTPKGSSHIIIPAEFLTICPAGQQNGVYVSPFLRSSHTVRVTNHLTDVYDTTYGVPHSVPGIPPKGSVLVTTSGDLTVYVAGHQTEVKQLAFRRWGACAH